MGLSNRVKNTVEGGAQVAVNVMKIPVGAVIAPLDDGRSIVDAANGIAESAGKTGEPEEPTHDR